MKNTLLKVGIFTVLVSVLVLSLFFVGRNLLSRFDFAGFINGAHIIREGEGRGLYEINVQEKYYEILTSKREAILFRNPPSVLLLYFPFTFLPFDLSYKFFLLVEMCAAILVSTMLSKTFPKINKNLVIFYTVFFVPGIISIITGQISYFLLIVWIFIFKFLSEKNSLLTGISSGLLFNKPQYLIFIPFVLLMTKNKKEYIKGFLLTFLILLLTSYLLVGYKALSDYPNFVLLTERIAFSSDPYSQISFSSFLYNISGRLKMIQGWEMYINLLFYLTALFYFWKIYLPKDKSKFFHLATIMILFFSPHVWDYDLVLVLPSFLYLLSKATLREGKTDIFRLSIPFILYFGWVIRFVGFPYLIPVDLILVAFYMVKS